MAFPLLISLREPLPEPCSALPVAGPWVCKATAAGCVSRPVMGKHTLSVAIAGSLWRSAEGLQPFAPQN